MEKYIVDGQGYNVAPQDLQMFLKKFPNAIKYDEPGKTTDPASSSMDSGSENGSSEQSEISVAKDINISPAGLFFNVLQETQPGVGKALAVLSDLGAGLFRTADEIGEFAETMVEIEAGKIGGIPGSGLAPYIAKRIAARQSGVTLEEFDETNPYNIIKLEGIANIFDKATIKYKDPETGQQEDFMSLFSKGEYGKSVESFVYETAGALPSLMVSRIPGGYAMLGGGAFANKLNTDLFKRPDQTAEKILSNALIYGGSDAIGEYIGGRYLNKLAGVVKGGGKAGLDRAKDVMIGGIGAFIKTAFKGGSSEFMQEAITSVIQSKSDEEIYGDEISTAQHFRQALHAGLIGFALGSGSGSVSLGMNKKNKTKFYEYLAPKSYKNDRLKLKQKELDAQKDLDNAPASKKEKFQKRLDNIKKKGEDLQNQLYDWFETTSKNDPKQIELMIEKIQEKHDALDIITGGDTYSNDAKEEAKRDFKDADGVISDLFSVTDINYDSEVELELDKYIRAAEEIDEANKSLWFKSKDLKYEYVNSQEKFDELKKQYGKEIANEADGFFNVTVDGQKKIFINRDVAASASATNVIGHELLHYALSNRFANDPKYLRDSVIAFNQYLNSLPEGKGEYIRKSIEKRLSNPKHGYAKLDANGKVQKDSDGLIIMNNDSWIEEYFTMFSDLIKDEKIDVVEDASKGLANTLRTTIRGLGLGFNNVDFKSGKEVFDFLIDYNKNLGRKGILGAITQRKAIKQAAGKGVKKAKAGTFASKTITDAVDKLGKVDKDGNNLTEKGTGNFYYQAEADDVVKEIKEKGYLDNLIAARYKADKVPKNFVSDVITALTPDIKAFKPEENNSLFGYLQGRITFRAGDVYNKIYKQKEEDKGSRDVGETTKEGDIKIQVAAEKSSEMEAFEEEDLSIRGQAKKAKADKQQYSEYRRKLGFETGSKIYNEVLDNVKKSLMMAYGTTQNITDAQLRAKAIATKLKKEYANLNSPLFKQIKNFLTYGVADVYVKRGTKDTYISNLKKFREDIVKNTSTADLVQMERNTPEADRIFTTFVKKLTSIDQVKDAVNREQLPPDALNKITKDKKTGKGAFSPSLYNKIMPTETELVSWADQPRINPVTGLRQGLKGTRKDGLAMRMVNGLVTDAIMEARQSEEVQNKIANMDVDPGSVAELGAAIGREVNVKFSKSNAIGDVTAAINGAGDVNVYSQIKFSKSHREAYEKQLTKRRPDLTEKQRKNAVQSVFDFVDGKDIPNNKKSKYEKMAMHYTANGYLILPEDGYKVIEAERIADQKKLDPFSFKNPNVIIETYVGEVKATRTDPDKVKTFSNKTQYTNGVTVYDVEDSKQGQLDTRKVIDTHFGKKANPWCLCARDTRVDQQYGNFDNRQEAERFADEWKAKGYKVETFLLEKQGEYEVYADLIGNKKTELNAAWSNWKKYNQEGNGFKIAFHNGRLVAFRDGNNMSWWDRNDSPTDAPIVRGKKAKDGFRPIVQVQPKKPGIEPKILKYEKVVGDNKTGSIIVKNLDGVIISEYNSKNGKLHGRQFEFTEGDFINIASTSIYENGDRLSDKETRVYKNKKDVVENVFGRDAIHLDNITNYEITNNYTDYISNLGRETIKVEGTVNQTPGLERYYELQGQKVNIEITLDAGKARSIEDIRSGKLQTLKINGEQQDLRLKFSKSAENNVKFSLTTLEEKNKLDPYISKKIKEYKDGNNVIANDFYSKLQEERARGNDVITSYDAAYAQVKKQHSIDFMPLQELEDSVKTYYAKEIRSDAKKYAADYYKSLLKGLETEEQVGIVAEYLINIGRPIRSSMVDYITTNEKLLEQEVSKIFGKDYTKYFELTKARRGFKVEIRLDGKLQPLGLYQEITAIKSNPSKYAETIDKQADQAREWLYKLLDSGLDKGRIKAILSLTSYGQRSPIRKLSKLGYYVRGKAKDLVLEHEITASDILGKIIDHVDGKINRTELGNFLNNAYVHVLPNKINSLIKKYPGHTSNRNGKGYESMPKVLDYVKGLKLQGKTELLNPKPKDRQTFASAVKQSRSANNPTKGITVLDFDDTLATTKSLVKFTRPDGTTGTLNAEQYASTYENLLDQGYTFDFSEFNKVVKGKLAPLFQKALKLQGKFGPENMFVLTARPPAAQKAIFDFLKANGLNIPIDNITGLGNSTAEAKALWVAEKVGEGYNDFYFADDALQNVQAVDNMLKQFDVKSKVQQAKVKFSKSMNDQFNDILENVTGIESIKRFSIIKGRKRGESKGKFRYFVPPSHEDFVGLLYNFMGKGKEGNKHRDFLEQALVRPLNRANRELDTARQSVANDYKELNKQFEDVKSKFTKKTPDGDFTFQDAIRVYLWDKHGYKIPGLSETDQTKLAELVMSDPQLQAYAETLNVISKQETYVNPTDGWNGGDIRMDLDDATGRIGREQYFSEFIENTSIIFSEENLNKIEAGYGKEVRESLEDMLYRIKTGRNRPTGQNAQVNKLMNYLNGSVGTVMFFNMRSALLQQMSIVNYINFADNNIFAAAKAFANQKQYWADWSFIFNSDMLKQRRGGIQTDVNGAELAASLRNSKDITRKLISKLLELGFLPTQIGDNIAIATGGATYYRNRINTYLKQGLSKKEAEAKAFTDFQDITQSTQQSARPDMVSKQQASVIGKVILNFQNVTSQFNRLGKKAFQDIYNRRITKPNTTQMQSDISNAARITYYFAVQNAIFYTLQTALFAMMFDDDEEDNNNLFLKKRERLINGSVDSVLRGTGLIGGVVATLKNVAIAFARQRDVKYNPDESAVALEALNLSPVLGIKFRKIVNAEKTLNYNKKVIDEMETFDIDNPQWSAVTNYTEAFTNIPLNRLYNKTQNVRQALNNEHAAWERTLMFLGWSQYNLNLENKKMEEIKAKTKSKGKSKFKGIKPRFKTE